MAQRTLNNIQYQLFIVTVSVLAVVNAGAILLLNGQPTASVLALVDALLTPIFLFDFVLRVIAAPSKWRYFFIQFGWADLLGSLWLPGMDILRIFRVYRVVTIAMEVPHASGGRPWRTLRHERANSVLGSMILLAILVLELGGVAVLYFESASPSANITSAGDSLWWGMVTIATVGYGDRYPVTPGGRMVGTAEIITGVVVFSTISGYLANAFISRRKSADQEVEQEAAQKAAQAADADALLAAVKRQAADQAGQAAALEARLARIESLLASLTQATDREGTKET